MTSLNRFLFIGTPPGQEELLVPLCQLFPVSIVVFMWFDRSFGSCHTGISV